MQFREQFFDFNKRGLIQGPQEKREDFLYRCHLATTLTFTPPSPRAKQLFDIDPDWIETAYDNQGLSLWEGGCTWIENQRVKLQLRKSFLKNNSYLGYSKEEILAHELVHAVRGGFNEPIYEEILAYQTSSSRFRRFWGPFFRNPKEASILLAIFGLLFLSNLFEFFFLPCFCATFILLIFGVARLLKTQTTFKKAKANLTSLITPKNALPTLLRLTDNEITRFSKLSPQAILAYAREKASSDLRWQQILHAYF